MTMEPSGTDRKVPGGDRPYPGGECGDQWEEVIWWGGCDDIGCSGRG